MKCVAWKSNQAVELCTISSFIKGFCSAYKITSASYLYATYAQHGVHPAIRTLTLGDASSCYGEA